MNFRITCLLVCTIVIQTITAQCVRGPYSPAPYANELVASATNLAETAAIINTAYPALPYAAFESPMNPAINGLTYGLSISDLAASNGGGLRVNSASPMASTGVKVETDSMVIEGPLAVTGQLPFLGVVALEGPLPAAGTGAVAYECGDGNVGIVTEGIEPVYPNVPLATGYPNGPIAPGYPNGLAYPNGAIAPGYNGPIAPGYANMPLAPGYPNPGLAPYPNGMAPGYGPLGPV